MNLLMMLLALCKRLGQRVAAVVMLVALGAVAMFALALPASAAGGYSFYQGCGGTGTAAQAYLTNGTWVNVPCGTSRSSGVLQVRNVNSGERVYDGGSNVCYVRNYAVTIRGTGASGRGDTC